MSHPTLSGLAEAAQKLSDDDLRRLLQILSADYKDRLKRAEKRAALSLAPGDEVESTVPGRNLPVGSPGRVLHVARTRVHVDFGERGTWAVLASGLKKPSSPNASSSPSATETPSTR